MTESATSSLREFTMPDGVRIVADAFGNPNHPPLLFAHGGGQTRHSWGGTAELLAKQGWYCLCYDHRGHGESGWSPDGIYNLGLFASDQREVASQLPTAPIVIGASLGGIATMLSQGEATENLYRAIVLVDITPTMNDDGALNVVNFMLDSMEAGFADLDEAAAAIASYTGRPQRKSSAGLKKNLRLGDDQRYRWHWDPKFVLQVRYDRKSHPQRMTKAVKNISLPMLLIRGRMSELVTEKEARQFLEIAPHAEYVDVENAAHMVAGDKNDIFTQAVVDFIDRLSRGE